PRRWLPLERPAEVVAEQAGPAADEGRKIGNVRPNHTNTVESVIIKEFGGVGRCRTDQNVTGIGGDIGISSELWMLLGRVKEQEMRQVGEFAGHLPRLGSGNQFLNNWYCERG